MKLFRNLKTAFRYPSHIPNYLRYRLSQLRNGGDALLTVTDRVRIGGFVNYSEYSWGKHQVEDHELRFLQEYPFPDGDIIDVGANIGVVTSILARRYPGRRIHAFEPNPSTFRTLCDNLARNGMQNVLPVECGVCYTEGRLAFQARAFDRARSRIAAENEIDTISVKTVRLDDYCERNAIDRIGFLKVDVEGHEATVFRGAERLLKEHIPKVIIYEVCPGNHDRTGNTVMAATEILKRHGYQIFDIDDRGSLRSMHQPSAGGVVLANWVAIPEESRGI